MSGKGLLLISGINYSYLKKFFLRFSLTAKFNSAINNFSMRLFSLFIP